MGAILKGTLRKATRNVSECRNAGGYKILSYVGIGGWCGVGTGDPSPTEGFE